MGEECENCEGAMYTVDDFLAKLEQVKREHGGDTPVVVPTTPEQRAFENAAVNIVTAARYMVDEGGEVFHPSETGDVVVLIF